MFSVSCSKGKKGLICNILKFLPNKYYIISGEACKEQRPNN